MHRVRVGLIGLAWVFLLVMLATALVHVAGDRGSNAVSTVVNGAGPSEPLAELGVAPGNAPPEKAAPPSAQAPTRPAPAAH